MTDKKEGDDLLEKLEKLGKKKAAEPPPALTSDVIAKLVGMSPLEYAQKIKGEAAKYKVPLHTLEKLVDTARKERSKSAPSTGALSHWAVDPWPEEVDGAKLLDDLRHEFSRYVALPPHVDVALALWELHTYVFELFDITPYLAITSPTRRCGKTVLMTMIYWLSRCGKKSDSMSKAAIYRSVDGEKPTLVLDEVGWVLDQKDDRQGILCGGFERNGYVEVCEGEGSNITVKRFSTYCPKAFGLIGKLTGTLMDRSIHIPMRRKLQTDRIERLRRKDNPRFAELRQRALRWANDNRAALEAAPSAVDDKLNDRALDFWEPLYAIADVVGGDWSQRAREAAHALSGDEAEDSALGLVLLRDIKSVFDASTLDYAYSRKLLDHLHDDPEKPWVEFGRTGKPITEKGVAELLHEYNIVSKAVGPKEARAKGYRKADFEDAWRRYLRPESELKAGSKAESVPNPGSLPFTRSPRCNDYEKAEKTAVHQDVGEREKIDTFPNEINSVNGWTGAKEDSDRAQVRAPLPADDDGLPASLRRCYGCGKPATETEPVVECGKNGSGGHYHLACWTAERTGAPQPQEATKSQGGMTSGRAREWAARYLDRATDEHDNSPTGEVNSAAHDAWLREELRAEVPPGELEAAFQQVMDHVFTI